MKVYSNKTQTGATSSTYKFNTPFPAFGSVTDVVSNINSNYHALTLDITRPRLEVPQLDADYTWAHALDFNQTMVTAASGNNFFDPLANARSNYGNSGNDIRQRFVGWAIFNVPGIHQAVR